MKGLRVPLGVNMVGGAARNDGDDHASQTLLLALNDDDNTNAFQQELGIGVDMIFDTKNMALRARIMSRVNAIFRRFEQLDLFKLVRGSIKWDDSVEGELSLNLSYINLESDEVKSFSRRFAARTGT
jgi:hypothetical protein